MVKVISETGRAADEILLDAIRPDKTAAQIFAAIPREELLKLIRLLEAVRAEGVVEDNACSACGHAHRSGTYDFDRRMLMLERAEQTRDGRWQASP